MVETRQNHAGTFVQQIKPKNKIREEWRGKYAQFHHRTAHRQNHIHPFSDACGDTCRTALMRDPPHIPAVALRRFQRSSGTIWFIRESKKHSASHTRSRTCGMVLPADRRTARNPYFGSSSTTPPVRKPPGELSGDNRVWWLLSRYAEGPMGQLGDLLSGLTETICRCHAFSIGTEFGKICRGLSAAYACPERVLVSRYKNSRFRGCCTDISNSTIVSMGI